MILKKKVGNTCKNDADCYAGATKDSCDTKNNKCYNPKNNQLYSCPCSNNNKAICGGTGNAANTCYCYIGYTGLNCETGSYSKINLKKNLKFNS
jgi:hypothetical protein